VHGDSPDILEQWRQAHRHRPAPHTDDRHQNPADTQQPAGATRRRRRRRRRGRGGRGPVPGGGNVP
jgi:hypothetical protein